MTTVNTLQVGKMPGRLTSVAVQAGTTIKEILVVAGITGINGYEIKVDGVVKGLEDAVVAGANTVLLTKKVKGNNTMITLQVGKMPGRLTTVGINAGQTVSEALSLAGVTNYAGYEIKLDGAVKTDGDAINSGTTLLLTKKVKGNMAVTLQVGKMPGRLSSVVIEEGQTVAEALAFAEVTDYTGYEIKLDGVVKSESDAIQSGTTLLLTKKVKGNQHTVQIGIMPGRLTTLALEPATSYKEAFRLAGIDPTGYEVKADGNVVTNFDAVTGQPTTILLTKKVKGNN